VNPAAADAKRSTRRVLIWHGYLLRGTGSNVYNASLAQALARLGHDVHLMCQDRGAGELPWVDRTGVWERGELRLSPAEPAAGRVHSGTVTAYVPDIGGLLPVYVYDRYEGFEVKTFGELTDEELDAYIAANVAAARDVVSAADGVDAALANHLVMGPLILARGGLRYAAKIHGSALEFTVRPNPRFLPHAEEGMRAAAAVLVGSRHTAESLWATLDGLDLPAKTRLGPPGVDTELFTPRPPAEAVAEVRRLAAELATAGTDEWGRDCARAASALEAWAGAEGPRVVVVGKLIASKGIDLLLAAWPLVASANPGARLLVIAFGEGQEVIESLLSALEDGDVDIARAIAASGLVTAEADPVPLRMLDSFLARAPAGYAEAARAGSGTISLAGRLEHGEVARVLPAADALVFPSTFPEAFGMVAAEAASCGILPIGADHSGIREVAGELAAVVPAEHRELLSFPIDDGAVAAIADRLNRWLALPPAERRRVEDALPGRVRELWSWESVAQGVLAASDGRLDGLPVVPEP
jgi:glycosyltransferase involved in cell wall biosynthesis